MMMVACQSSFTPEEKGKQSPSAKSQKVSKSKSEENKTSKYPTLNGVEEARDFLNNYKPQSNSNIVRVEASYGEIWIELFTNTPNHRKNFLYLVDRGYFNGTWFHRVSKNHVIQAGNNDEYSLAHLRKEIGEYKLKPEALGLNYHQYGAVAMARSYKNNPEKLSDPFEFYVSLGPRYKASQLRAMEEQYGMKLNQEQMNLYQKHGGSPHLDGEHTVFGKVIKGMEVLEEISKVETDEGEWPIENIPIKIFNAAKVD